MKLKYIKYNIEYIFEYKIPQENEEEKETATQTKSDGKKMKLIKLLRLSVDGFLFQ